MAPLGTAILTPESSAKQGKKGVSIGPYRGPFGPLYKPYTPIALRQNQITIIFTCAMEHGCTFLMTYVFFFLFAWP